ncbi:MAG: SsrA-binding protein SmpB [Anaerolineales bacterium]|nr:SsrA-binding protein SmpB [Anaerolineales bacterium]
MAESRKIIANNRRASHDYFLEDRFEAGLVLTGTEIKSIRAGKVSLQHSYVSSREGEMWLIDAHIAPYDFGNIQNHDPKRPRKLLLNRREINRLIDKITTRGYTIVPTLLYLKDGRAKLEIALARGKHKYDKRESLAKRDSQRQVERALRDRYHDE